MKFIADVMLGKLAKRMRLLGLDVLYGPSISSNEVLRLALDQGRTILTRDSGLASRPLAQNHLLIKYDLVDKQLQQVLGSFPPMEGLPLTRCSFCNNDLDVLSRAEVRDLVPNHMYEQHRVFLRCATCGRVYWEGTHVKQMERFLKLK